VFKPFKGKCVLCSGDDKWIVVKKGYCGRCNDLMKPKKVKHPKWDKIFGKNGSSTNKQWADGGSGQDEKTDRFSYSRQLEKKNEPADQKNKKVQHRRKRIKKNTPIKKNRKATGEKLLFLEIWEEREHKCSCCGRWLGEEPKPIFFSHLLAKGTYPSLRLVKRNIWLKCPEHHHAWEFGDRNAPEFDAANREARALKLEYYTKKI